MVLVSHGSRWLALARGRCVLVCPWRIFLVVVDVGLLAFKTMPWPALVVSCLSPPSNSIAVAIMFESTL